MTRRPEHPKGYRFATKAQRLHVAIAERALGHPLPRGSEVHHVNEDKHDNRPSNLVICQDRAYHALLHLRRRVMLAGGNPNTQRLCYMCGQLRRLDEMGRRLSGPRPLTSQCLACCTATGKRWFQRHPEARLARKAQYQAWRLAGVCGMCGEPTVSGKSKCLKHFLQAREQRYRRERRQSKGQLG